MISSLSGSSPVVSRSSATHTSSIGDGWISGPGNTACVSKGVIVNRRDVLTRGSIVYHKQNSYPAMCGTSHPKMPAKQSASATKPATTLLSSATNGAIAATDPTTTRAVNSKFGLPAPVAEAASVLAQYRMPIIPPNNAQIG